MSSNNTGPAIVGGDWPNALPVTTYGAPKPKQTGLDWGTIGPGTPAVPRCKMCSTEMVGDRCSKCAERDEVRRSIENRPTHTQPVAASPTPAPAPKVRKHSPLSAAPRAEDLRPTLVETIRRLYYEDIWSTVEIGAEVGLNANTVASIMRRNGMKLRSGETANVGCRRRVAARLAELGVTSMTVRVWARSQGIGAPMRGSLSAALVELYAAHVEADR